MPHIKALDKTTIRSIHSGQVITTIDAIVKELLEQTHTLGYRNSLDAQANSIDIKILDDGLLKIEVRDDGCGIALTDRCNMAKQHYTSKLATFADLERMTTYGFRGEALSALCEVSGEVFLTTKTKEDSVATCYKLDRNGSIISESASGSIHHTGTLVSIYQPFIHLPVRRQVAMKTKSNSTKKIQDLVIKYGLSHPFIRLTLQQLANTVGKSKNPPVWIKPSTKNLTDGVRMIYGPVLASMVEECSLEEKFDQQLDKESSTPIRLHCLLPYPSQIFKGERVFIYVDKRPINYTKSELKELVTMVRKRYKQALGVEDDGKKLPFMYIDIKTGYGDFDVNIEPDKSVVLLHGKARILDVMQEILDQTYGSFFSSNKTTSPNEKSSTRFSHTTQQVPCRSPQSDPLRSPDPQTATQLDHHNAHSNDLRDELDEEDDLDDESDALFMDILPRHNSPPLLTEWLHQQEIPDKEPVLPMHDMNVQEQQRLPALDWQVDDESCAGNASPPTRHDESIQQGQSTTLDWQLDDESPPPSPPIRHAGSINDKQRLMTLDWQVDDKSQIEDPSPPQTPTNPLSDWLARFRRPTNPSKRRDSEDSSIPSAPIQAKRPRVQIHLPFTCDRPKTIPSPAIHDTDSSIAGDSSSPSDSAFDDTPFSPFDTIHSADNVRPQDISNKSLKPASPIHTDSAASKRRNIAPIFTKAIGSSSKALLYSSDHNGTAQSDLISTQNDIIPVNTLTTLDDIKKSYTLHRDRHSQVYRKSVADYCKQISSPTYRDRLDEKQSSSVILEKKLKDGIMLFSQGAYTDIGWMGKSIGVLDMNLLQQRYKFQQLMGSHILSSGKSLPVPPQITIRSDSPLYSMIISLEKRDEYIAEDGRKSTEHTYSLITDKRVTANGFRARWRKEPYSHDLVVQFTAIADLNGYGPSDFDELLKIMHRSGDTTDLKRMRPSKVIEYFANKANHLVSGEETAWDVMLAALDEDTQNRFDVAPVHYLL